MKRYLKFFPWLLCLGLLFLIGCAEEETTAPTEPTDPLGWINQGWSQYSGHSYDAAYESFNRGYAEAQTNWNEAFTDSAESVTLDSLGNLVILDSLKVAQAQQVMQAQGGYLIEALLGIGWTSIKTIRPAIATLVFDAILLYDADHVDALAGYAFMLQTVDEWQQSNMRAIKALTLDATWSFDHETQLDYRDLRLVIAENYYYLANFEASLQEALALNTLLSYQPNLSADDFNLATIEGRAALIELIAALDDLI